MGEHRRSRAEYRFVCLEYPRTRNVLVFALRAVADGDTLDLVYGEALRVIRANSYDTSSTRRAVPRSRYPNRETEGEHRFESYPRHR